MQLGQLSNLQVMYLLSLFRKIWKEALFRGMSIPLLLGVDEHSTTVRYMHLVFVSHSIGRRVLTASPLYLQHKGLISFRITGNDLFYTSMSSLALLVAPLRNNATWRTGAYVCISTGAT